MAGDARANIQRSVTDHAMDASEGKPQEEVAQPSTALEESLKAEDAGGKEVASPERSNATSEDDKEGVAVADNTDEEKPGANCNVVPAGSRSCATCKGRRVNGCENNSCKRCCVRLFNGCAVHSNKESRPKVDTSVGEAAAAPARSSKLRKAVLKREFKETNIMYYEETVTIFCVKDFFGCKKLSQSILNDQSRSLRVNGSYLGKQAPKRKRTSESAIQQRIRELFNPATANSKAEQQNQPPAPLSCAS
ncbi:TPA: hypothetical protein N0F65_008493 [Lagenidium giganteum]|uniref:Uncharacterized protein n=1 Tax=Lagenidium giganteum TaxID=4803 RepID=A0AAV2Z582_9STRA|nr:TPA: hypothetical protein N0F65_008493 [Lagenidium giganteum]